MTKNIEALSPLPDPMTQADIDAEENRILSRKLTPPSAHAILGAADAYAEALENCTLLDYPSRDYYLALRDGDAAWEALASAVLALAAASPALPAPPSANEGGSDLQAATERTQEYTLRAMALNYTKGHSWDALDARACIEAADEIKTLRALAVSALLPQPEKPSERIAAVRAVQATAQRELEARIVRPIAEAVRRAGMTLCKTANGYEVRKFGPAIAGVEHVAHGVGNGETARWTTFGGAAAPQAPALPEAAQPAAQALTDVQIDADNQSGR